jgi:thiol-disulfide isomerase/thioredoxin
MPEAVVYSRPGCHLCERAEHLLASIARDYPMVVRRVNVDDVPQLAARFGERIPVVAIDGRVVAAGRVSEYRLRKALGIPPTPRGWLGLARSAFRPESETT